MSAINVQAIMFYGDFWDNFTSTMAGIVRIGEIAAYNINGLVEKVKARSRVSKSKIKLLEIYAHGTDTYINLGSGTDNKLSSFTPDSNMPKFVSLTDYFDADGCVSLRVCQAGKLTNVLLSLSATIGVPVYANTGDVMPNIPYYDGSGEMVVARPDGGFARGSSVTRPT